jgi:hypothetical protein
VAQVNGLAKEFKQADEELMKLAEDRDRTRSQKDSQDVEHVRLQTQFDTFNKMTAKLGPENSGNQQEFAKAAAVSQAAGQQAADNLRAAQLQHQIDALEKIKQLHAQQVESLEKEITSQDEVSKVGSVGIEKLRKDQQVASAQYKSALEEQIQLIEKKNDILLKGAIDEQRGSRAGARGSNKADSEALRAAEVELNQMRRAHAVSLAEEQAFWEQKLSRFRANTSEYATIVGSSRRSPTRSAMPRTGRSRKAARKPPTRRLPRRRRNSRRTSRSTRPLPAAGKRTSSRWSRPRRRPHVGRGADRRRG